MSAMISAEHNRAMLDLEIKNLIKQKEMNYSKTRDVKSPCRGHEHDAGIDFFVPNDFAGQTIMPGKQIIIDTGIKIDVPVGHALVAFNKSGVATRKQLLVGACVIDHGYQGTININLHNVGDQKQTIEPGEKVVQFVLLRLGTPYLLEIPEEDLFAEESARGVGKFGSTGII
jgi:dUTP pyrophosphatase